MTTWPVAAGGELSRGSPPRSGRAGVLIAAVSLVLPPLLGNNLHTARVNEFFSAIDLLSPRRAPIPGPPPPPPGTSVLLRGCTAWSLREARSREVFAPGAIWDAVDTSPAPLSPAGGPSLERRFGAAAHHNRGGPAGPSGAAGRRGKQARLQAGERLSLCGKFAIHNATGTWRPLDEPHQRTSQPAFGPVGPDGRPTNADVRSIMAAARLRSPPMSPSRNARARARGAAAAIPRDAKGTQFGRPGAHSPELRRLPGAGGGAGHRAGGGAGDIGAPGGGLAPRGSGGAPSEAAAHRLGKAGSGNRAGEAGALQRQLARGLRL